MVWRRKTKAPDSEELLRMISFNQRAFDGPDVIEGSPAHARLEQKPTEVPETTSRGDSTKYKTAVVATIPSDSHTWNLVFIELFLAEQGYTVTNLGCCTPFETVVQKCRELQPALLAISTINGHGVIDGTDLGRQIAALPTQIRPVAVVGGKLGLSGPCPPETVAALEAAGFHAVFDNDRALEDFRAFLAKLEARETTVEPTMREDAASEALTTGQVA
jgi:methylaspartate mutase sigma subunit